MINIEVISKPRGAGKTYDLIMKSAKTNVPILTAYNTRRIREEAERMGVEIPNPMDIKMYKHYKEYSGLSSPYWKGEILIDDVDEVLKELLGVKVNTVTLTPDSMDEFKINEKTAEEIHEMAMKVLKRHKNKHVDIYKEEKDMSIYCRAEEGWGGEFTFHVYNPNQIVDVNIILPNKVVEVTFLDGKKQKSVCREPDTFSLETAISICISKKIMGGSSAYNNAVKRGMKVYEDKLKKIEEDKAEQERIAKKKAKRESYKTRRTAKREAAEKEKAIAIQTEAYIRAMEEMENRKNGKNG